ncbi:MAG: hypothetical protein GY759_21395 [Chloroflexi bacterium]|nr:hypothetical protein [Chloroflexota bacterium]
MAELLGTLTATVITLAIFSRVWRSNAAFRAAQYLLLGTLAGYVAAITLKTVLLPGFALPQTSDPLAWIPWFIPLLLIALLALRFSGTAAIRSVGLLPLGLLLGSGGALVLAGALRGTLIPQLLAPLTMSYLPLASSTADTLTVVAATLTSIAVLVYFQQRSQTGNTGSSLFLSIIGKYGFWALMIAFGALLATTAGARITLFIDRIQYLIHIWSQLLSGGS